MDVLGPAAEFLTIVSAITKIYKEFRKKYNKSISQKGIIDQKKLGNKRRIPGEAFAAEILTKPIRIEQNRKTKAVRIVIDRSNVQHAVINTEGKKILCQAV